ncbi:MAG: hypothetical protein Q4G16_09095 [Cruoricaptor ignavus]|nr:hypothetical protein [Cruoricaptor ignavus]
MKKIIKVVLLSTITAVIAVFVLSFSINGISIKSLSANAGTKCVQASNSDCLSRSTGNIYHGYRAGQIGKETETIE